MLYLVRYTDFNHTLIPYTDRYILEALRQLVPETVDFYFDQSGDMSQQMAKLRADFFNPGGFLTFDTGGKSAYHNILDGCVRDLVCYYSDAPYTGFFDFIEKNPPGTIVTYSDRSFAEFYQDIGLNVTPVFLPHGGPNKILSEKPMEDRAYPISFIGHLKNPHPAGSFDKVIKAPDPRVAAILKQASEEVLEEKQDIYIAFKKACLDMGFNPLGLFQRDQLFKLLQMMSAWAQMHHRLRVLRAFKGQSIDIFGPVYEEIDGITDQNHTMHGPKLGEEVFDILADTRVLINAVGVFPRGSHERIWFGMAHGCALWTDESEFVSETFTDPENIKFIKPKLSSEEARQIVDLSDDFETLETMTAAAKPIYLGHHTWEKRIAKMFSEVPVMADYLKTK